MSNKEHVVILGGGFAGRYAAKALALRLFSQHRITLIDRVDHMLYTPMLTEVAGGTVPPQAVAVSAKSLGRRVEFIQGEIGSVDVHTKTVTMQTGQVITATHLVIALGSTSSYHGIEGAEENSIPLKTLKDAEIAAWRIDEMAIAAAADHDVSSRRHRLTLVVAGGGYTGVETIAALYARLRRKAALAGIDPEEVSAFLIEPSNRLMSEMPQGLASYGQLRLEQDGIRVLTGNGVKEVSPDGIVLTNGERHKPGLLVWDTGIEPSPLIREMDVPTGQHHGVLTDSAFRVQGIENVWAMGDCAEVPQPGTGKTYAPTAQNAVREGAYLAKNISAVIRGREPQPFKYKMLGQLALISERDAVANVLGVPLRGSVAWAAWWIVYLAKLPGVLNRVSAAKGLARSVKA